MRSGQILTERRIADDLRERAAQGITIKRDTRAVGVELLYVRWHGLALVADYAHESSCPEAGCKRAPRTIADIER